MMMRVSWDPAKSKLLKQNRGIDFDEAAELFQKPYVMQSKNDDPEQYKAIGFARGGVLVCLIVEIRQDSQGDYEWFVTLWKATKAEARIYEQNI